MKALLLDELLRIRAVTPPQGGMVGVAVSELLPDLALQRALKRYALGLEAPVRGYRSVLRLGDRVRRVVVDASYTPELGLLLSLEPSELGPVAPPGDSSEDLAVLRQYAPLVEFRRGTHGDWPIFEVSGATTQILGASREEVLYGPGWRPLVHPEDLARVSEAALHAQDSRVPYRVALRLQGPGEPRWLWELGAPDPLGGLRGFWVDVTGLVSGERSLRGSEQLFRDGCEHLPAMMWVSSPDGHRILYATPSFEAFFGVSLAQVYLEPRFWLESVHPEDKERAYEVLRGALHGGHAAEDELRMRNAQGEERWVWARALPVRDPDGTVRRMVGLNLDITDRKTAEHGLKQREADLRGLLEQASDAIFIFDAQGRILEVNSRACALSGYSRAELLQRSIQDLTPADDLITRPLPAVGSGELTLVEHRLIHSDGTGLDVEISAAALADGRVQSIVRDITRRKEEERHRARLESQLQQVRTLESVGRLAGGIAHDFNNMLAVILNRAELLLQDLGPADGLREELRQIHGAASRAAALTRQLLVFSRRDLPDARALDLNEVIRNLSGLLRSSVGEAVNLRLELAPQLPAVKLGLPQLENLLVNMAVNARDAMPQGGELRFITEAVVLDRDRARRVHGVEPGDYVRLSVVDTGKGMSAEVAVHVFEPFFTTKSRTEGTGLGLATAYGTVRQAGGRITVQSAPGKGARFEILLPASSEPAEAPRAVDEPRAQGPRRPTTVMLVEDEPAVRQVFARMLERSGYQVLEAEGGAQALALAREHQGPLDALVTDVVMPGLSGKELADAMVAERPQTRVLFMSGYTNDLIAHHGVLEEGIAFLQKPFKLSTLLSALSRLLGDEAPRAGALER